MSDAGLLARHEGPALFGAPEAILKGLLESENAVSLLLAPRGEPFGNLLRTASSNGGAEILRAHDLRLCPVPTAARAVTLALHAARSGAVAIALVPNAQLAATASTIAEAAREVLPRGGALGVVLEDHPRADPEACPYGLLRPLDLPCLAPADIESLREAMDTTLRLSRAGARCIGLVVHTTVLRSAATIEALPNRVIETVDAMLARRRLRRPPRVQETRDVMRVVRRLEVNRSISLPSPGERTPLGFVTVGPTRPALRHLVDALQLAGRVPHLHLGAVHPVDGVVVSRLLARCEQVIVLEPRPGMIESSVLEVAEAMRQRGERPGTVWGRLLPPGPDGAAHTLAPDEALHPSLLARRIVHLLHMTRPGGAVASRLVPDPVKHEMAVAPRGASVGPPAALATVRRLAAEVDQWLRDQKGEEGEEGEEEAFAPTALAVDGVLPGHAPQRMVMLETWSPERFLLEGNAAVRQAAREDRPWIFVVCDVGTDDGQDLGRLARGVVPGEGAARVTIEEASFADGQRLLEMLRAAAFRDGMTILIVRDPAPARFDIASIERARAEIDRLGFEPRQRVVWPVDRACAIRRPIDDDMIEERGGQESPEMRSALRVDRLPRRGSSRWRVRARPLLEQVDLIRTSPPTRRWRRDPGSKLPLPEVVHRRASNWRAHLAGIRGEAPGLAARVLADAGRRMGYDVRLRFEPTPIGPGRRAWTQVLFTHPRPGEAPPPLIAQVPFGEADLLLGLEAAETLRGVVGDPALRVAVLDRTHAVVNGGFFSDEGETEQARALRDTLRTVLREVTVGPTRLLEDFTGACRAWFHTDRAVDVALLGAAFQRGLIPVTVDAIDAAMAAAESAGFGRAREAFQFGRHLAVDARLFDRPRDDREEDTDRIVRRMTHLLRLRRWPQRRHVTRFASLLEESVRLMPGLRETDSGRQALRDFVIALSRCDHWGGVEYAERYANLITDLYRADRGDTGRALARTAVLPLADALLILDPVYIGTMTMSPEQRRRVRQVFNVKRARGDELTRRYLTRIDVLALRRRIRIDIRTSDWAARAVALLRFVVPAAWRGTRRERDLAAYVVDLVERAGRGSGDDYEHYQHALLRLHQQALDNRLRGMALSEMKLVAEPEGV